MQPDQNNPQNPITPAPDQPDPNRDEVPAQNPPAQTMPSASPYIEPPTTPGVTPVYPQQAEQPLEQNSMQNNSMLPTDVQPLSNQQPIDPDPDANSMNTKAIKIKRILLVVVPLLLLLSALLIYFFPVSSGAASKYANAIKEQNLSVENDIYGQLNKVSSTSTPAQIDRVQSDLASLKNSYDKTVSERPKLTTLPLGSINSNYKLAKATQADIAKYDAENIELINEATRAVNYVSVVFDKVNDFQELVKTFPTPTASNLALVITKVDELAKTASATANSIEQKDAPDSFSDNKNAVVKSFNNLSSIYNKFTQAINAKNTTQINEAIAAERKEVNNLFDLLADTKVSEVYKSQVQTNRELGDKIQSNLNQL